MTEENVSRFDGEDQHGWAPDGEDGPGTAAGTAEKAFDASNAGPAGPGREVSDEEREGVPPTDTTGRTPLGVGESDSKSAEDLAREAGPEEGRVEEGTQGASQRPVGSSTAEHSTGVDPQE